MGIEFYNVKKKAKVTIADDQVKKVKYTKEGSNGKEQVRYAFKSVDDGTKLTKFCSKDAWDTLDVEIVNP